MATPNLSFQNFFTTTLASGITASDTTIYLNSLPTGSEGYLVIEPDSSTNKEIIYYTSKGANFVTLPSVAAGRGVGGTTAVSHSSGVTVQMNVVAEHFKALQDGTAFAVGGIGASAYADGWTPILGSTPNTVTYNGNRNYDLVFNSVDLSSTLSPGQKLKFTRTVAAPTQCTDLESTSSQYYSKTSPAGMTFTDDFVVSAWIKLESYPTSYGYAIASRYNGTSGWDFLIGVNGNLILRGYNGGAGNNRYVYTYSSIPLNKWVHVTAQLDMSTYTATSTTCYVMVDGVDVPAGLSTSGTNPTALVQAGDLQIGAANTTGYFDGKIAQVAIFNAKVTQATIRSYISQGLSGSETSLISAYSFNNSINDLNTTNANNLTASGSAVATNADSPFANAVTAGTEEYGLVQKVTYSTNTTVNVQVPEGCAIPTSGGISNTYYSVGITPFGFVSDRGRWRIETVIAAQTLVTIAANNTWYTSVNNHGSIVVPPGSWKIGYEWNIVNQSTVGGNRSLFCVLSSSTPSTTYTINNLATHPVVYGSGVAMVAALSKSAFINLSSATTYIPYFASDAITGTDTTGFNNGGLSTTFAEPAGV